MSSPTVIRHATIEGETAVVITYTERSLGKFQFSATFQIYKTGLKDDATFMLTDKIWSTEQGAIKLFEEWINTSRG